MSTIYYNIINIIVPLIAKVRFTLVLNYNLWQNDHFML
jgi:hypothetical protein